MNAATAVDAIQLNFDIKPIFSLSIRFVIDHFVLYLAPQFLSNESPIEIFFFNKKLNI